MSWRALCCAWRWKANAIPIDCRTKRWSDCYPRPTGARRADRAAPSKALEQPACFVVRDHDKQQLAYVYFALPEEPLCRSDDLASIEAGIRSFRLSVPLKKLRRVAAWRLKKIGPVNEACSFTCCRRYPDPRSNW